MKVIERKVYYCDYCMRHRMSAASIEKHEPRCIYNPDRSECGWHDPHSAIPKPAHYVPQVHEDLDVDLIRTWADGCPACMLAVVVQAVRAGVNRDDLDFDYKSEVERFRSEERKAGASDVW